MPAKKKNRVIVRIWSSILTGGENVGHISIETPNCYMSLWPDDERKNPELPKGQKNFGVISAINKQFMFNANEDIAAERGRPPEKLLCFYSLNIEAIEARFKGITTDPEFRGWTLIGNNLLLNKGNAHSCASLAYTLLKAGGIYELISCLNSWYSGLSSSATPDALAGISIKAKQAELTKYPDTKKFGLFERTSDIPVINSEGVIEDLPRTEKEIDVTRKAQSSYCNYTTLAVGFFTLGATAAIVYKDMCPESVSDYCESLKLYLPFL